MQSPRQLEGGPLTVPLRFPSRTPAASARGTVRQRPASENLHTSRHTQGGDGTAVRLSAPGAVRHDVARQVVHVVLQIPDDVLDDVSDRNHAHDLARV